MNIGNFLFISKDMILLKLSVCIVIFSYFGCWAIEEYRIK